MKNKLREIILSENEYKDIIKCLLFKSSSDSCIENTIEDDKETLKLAISISKLLNINDLTDTNFYLAETKFYDNKEIVNEILNNFKVNKK